jgi:hypothetical protein
LLSIYDVGYFRADLEVLSRKHPMGHAEPEVLHCLADTEDQDVGQIDGADLVELVDCPRVDESADVAHKKK